MAARKKKPAAIHNEDVARIFDQLADLLEIDQANPFRVRAYRNAAEMLRSMTDEVGALIQEGEDLSKLPTIGKDLAGKIEEIVSTGHLEALESLKQTLPAGLADLTRVPGLGPKRVKRLHDELNVKSANDLKRLAAKGKIRGIPGFGEKTEKEIAAYFAKDRSQDERMRLADAHKIATRIVEHLSKAAKKKDITVAGSYRRRKETVGDLDILVASADPKKIIDHFVTLDEIEKIDSQGTTRATVHLLSGFQVDLRAVKPESYGAALVYFTGSKSHNIELRRRAVARGLKINEYGVFKGDKSIAGRTEKEVYGTIGLPYIPPELREERGEIEAAEKHKLPTLIETNDIRGDLHVHTNATDGRDTLRAMALAAKERGYDYIAITDHTKHTSIANGLDKKRLKRQIDRIEKLNDELSGFRILKSAEVDILSDGSLDLPDDILEKLDLTVCAVHFDFKLDTRKQTDRIIKAMDNPNFSILAHPTCRLIGERDPMGLNMERLMDAALERGCHLEVNGQPERMDLNDVYCRMAKEKGLKVALSTDAHAISQFDYIELSVSQARRAWIEKDDVLNARSWRDLKSLLKR